MPEVRLDAADAAELAEMLQFLSRLAGPRPRPPRPPRWKSSSATPPTASRQLRQDLDRFVFLLGGSDGEPLFGPAPH